MKYSSGQLPDFHPVILDESNGLSSNQVTCFFQDHNGYMWIGTDNGLYRATATGLELVADEIKVRSIYSDRDGNLWVGSEFMGGRTIQFRGPCR